MDLFDPKPELARRSGQPHPGEVETFQLRNKNVLMGSPFRFSHHGECGMELSELIPHIATTADDICLVRSMHTESNNHGPAMNSLLSGKTLPNRPCLGSWVSYAMGSDNEDLPGFIVLRDPAGYSTSGKLLWSSGWLPAQHGGVEFSAGAGSPVHYLELPESVVPAARRRSLAFLQDLNRRQQARQPYAPDLEARIANYELAARMQLEASSVLDLRGESEETKKLYGLDDPDTRPYGLRCLVARRLVEAGVRFVQIFPPVRPIQQPWDSHYKLPQNLPAICKYTDQPSAALIKDLKARGLLDDVLVVWSGEFGRLPITENKVGRDHNRNAFSLFLAGAGVKGGYVHGSTDELGYKVAEDPVSAQDLLATMLHVLGLDHHRLGYRHLGRDETITDPEVTHARVVDELLA